MQKSASLALSNSPIGSTPDGLPAGNCHASVCVCCPRTLTSLSLNSSLSLIYPISNSATGFLILERILIPARIVCGLYVN